MPNVTLKRVYNLYAENGVPHSFGPGKTDVPQWAYKQLTARGAVPSEVKKDEPPPQDTRPA